uniref:uncharacterized protein LOC120341864 n=1 Tax=Styela clava TaxID=7725 RepID=UPI00193983C4|nr:uncharacterized protein LOC120341864 [Styela clava]
MPMTNIGKMSFLFVMAFQQVSSVLPKVMKAEITREKLKSEYDCIGLIGKSEKDTKMLLRDCEFAMKSSVMTETKKFIENAVVEELTEIIHNYFEKDRAIFARRKRFTDMDCPTLNKQDLSSNAKEMRKRSLAPFVYKPDFNPNRFPKLVLHGVCLCSGCIDLTTGRETLSLSSLAITGNVTVFYKEAGAMGYTKREEPIPIGCTCVYPLQST